MMRVRMMTVVALMTLAAGSVALASDPIDLADSGDRCPEPPASGPGDVTLPGDLECAFYGVGEGGNPITLDDFFECLDSAQGLDEDDDAGVENGASSPATYDPWFVGGTTPPTYQCVREDSEVIQSITITLPSATNMTGKLRKFTTGTNQGGFIEVKANSVEFKVFITTSMTATQINDALISATQAAGFVVTTSGDFINVEHELKGLTQLPLWKFGVRVGPNVDIFDMEIGLEPDAYPTDETECSDQAI